MLPEVDPLVLSSNPQFARLHQSLCRSRLTPDGKSRTTDVKFLEERQAFSKALQRARIEESTRAVIRDGLHHAAYRSENLSSEIEVAARIVLEHFKGAISTDDQDIVDSQNLYLLDHADEVAHDTSCYLVRVLGTVSQATGASTTSKNGTILASNLAPHIQSIKNDMAISTSRLHEATISLAHESSDILTSYKTLIETIIRLLESVIHGSIARGTKAKSEYLVTMAEELDKQLSITEAQVLRQIYVPEVRDTLEERGRQLSREKASLGRAVRDLKGVLEPLERDEDIRAFVDEYMQVQQELSRMKGDTEQR